MKLSKAFCILIALLLLESCHSPVSDSGGNTTDAPYTSIPPPADGVASFTVCPLDLSKAGSVGALADIQGGGHVEPSPHCGIMAWFRPNGNIAVKTVQNIYAPANGNVIFVFNQGISWKIMFRCTSSFYYYLDHVVTSSPPALGTEVHAGDLLGQTEVGGALDVGAFDSTVILTGFVNPARYSYDELHCVTPWKYFVEPIKSALYAQIYRAPGGPQDGHIDQDVPGTLAGTWFEQSLPADASIVEGPQGWPKTISFALDGYDGVTPRISCGGWPASPGNPGLPGGGVWAIPAGLSSWSNITASSGLQEFPLLNIYDQTQKGLLAVKMISDSRIEIEIWPGSLATSLPFDSAALFYVR